MSDRLLPTEVRTGDWRAFLPPSQYDQSWIARVKARCVIAESGCWVWQGTQYHNGYGSTTYRSNAVIVHRKMLEIAKGMTLGRWEYACHYCDVRLCCNPDHLWKGTPLDNQVDSVKKGRNGEQKVTHCPLGHEYTPENTYITPAASGRPSRMCRECGRIKSRRRWWMKRGLSREEAMARAMRKAV